MVFIVSTLFTENMCFVGTVNTDSTRRKTATPVLNIVSKVAEGCVKVVLTKVLLSSLRCCIRTTSQHAGLLYRASL